MSAQPLCHMPDCLRHYVRRCISCGFRCCETCLREDLCRKCDEDAA